MTKFIRQFSVTVTLALGAALAYAQSAPGSLRIWCS
jgi:hypothetical protein